MRSAGLPTLVGTDPRKAFAERVRAIDPLFKRGDLSDFWPALRDLIAMAPARVDLSRKKSHYLASLAWRSILRRDFPSAHRFLAYADQHVDPSHLSPYFLRERAEFWRRLREAESGEAGP